MRTTIVLQEEFKEKIKPFLKSKKLSAFINQCIGEHFMQLEKSRQLKKLEASYQRAAKNKRGPDFSNLEVEDWPEW